LGPSTRDVIDLDPGPLADVTRGGTGMKSLRNREGKIPSDLKADQGDQVVNERGTSNLGHEEKIERERGFYRVEG